MVKLHKTVSARLLIPEYDSYVKALNGKSIYKDLKNHVEGVINERKNREIKPTARAVDKEPGRDEQKVRILGKEWINDLT
jgi:hypothetical protein